jgi:hypothetical protein
MEEHKTACKRAIESLLVEQASRHESALTPKGELSKQGKDCIERILQHIKAAIETSGGDDVSR